MLWQLLAALLMSEGDAMKVAVPRIAKPTIDNQIAEDEWRGAAESTLPGGARILLGTDGETLYFAIDQAPEARFGYGCLFVKAGADIHVLHASARLGSARYTRRDDAWRPDKPDYVWIDTGEAMWREEQWRAGVNPKTTQEFAVSIERLGERPLIALGYVLFRDRKPQAIGWPAALDDATRHIGLLSGRNPDDAKFSAERWARLEFP